MSRVDDECVSRGCREMSWMLVGQTSHEDGMGLTGIGSSDSELGAGGIGAPVGVIVRVGDVIVV